MTATDAHAAYQAGNAEALFNAMDSDQQARLRRAFLEHALMHVMRMLSGDPRYEAAQSWLRNAQRWLEQSAKPPSQEFRSLLKIIDAMDDQTVDGPKNTVDHLVSAFSMGVFPASKHAAYAVAKSVVFLAPPGMVQVTESTIPAYFPEPNRSIQAVALQVIAWHREVAWAILNDGPMPPPAYPDAGGQP